MSKCKYRHVTGKRCDDSPEGIHPFCEFHQEVFEESLATEKYTSRWEAMLESGD